MTESEKFVDEAVTPIPARDTWENLSTSELIAAKLKLEDFLWLNQRNPALAKPISEGISAISRLIDGRGSAA